MGVGIVIDGDLVDIGQVLELVPEHGPPAVGAGQQDSRPPAARSSAAARDSERKESGTRSARR